MLTNVTVENCATGIRAENSTVTGRNIKLRGNRTAISSTDSTLDFDGLDIE